ncbi:MAG TPA: glycosyltransferase family 2 protein [Crocinitomicaceae bacterium]|nr:glycosyltransferase family 2 protein [Crocinitomicaceae bacterium]
MKLSIVIPCRNEVDYIEECISAIYSNELPKDTSLSVFIVDGLSDDGTREKIQALKITHPSLVLIDNVKQQTPFAFNLGILAEKEADYIQIVGVRQILSTNYLKKAIEVFQDNSENWCVGGKVNNVYLNTKGRIIAQAMSTSFGMGLGNFRTLDKSDFVDTVGTPMYKKEVFEKIGLFDEVLVRNQDDDFNYRVTQAGGKIFYNNDISLKYYVRATFSGLWRQFFQYGYWKVYVNQKHSSVTTYRQLVPPAFVLYLFTVLILPLFGIKVFFVGLFPLIIYVLMNVFFSFKLAKSSADALQLLITYPILHISYGLGYVKGLIDFLLFKKQPSENQKKLSR